MKIQPFPQKIIEGGSVRADGLISIRCHNTDKPNIKLENYNNKVLYLTFDDVAVPEYHYGGKIFRGPTDTDIHLTLEFIDMLGGFNFLALHCHAGKSRSAALALLIHFYLTGNARASVEHILHYDNEKQMCFNPLLIRMADRMWNAGLDEILADSCKPYSTWKTFWQERGF